MSVKLVDHAQPVRLLCLTGSPVISICMALPAEQAREQRRRAAPGRQADHRLRLAEGGVVGRDDEVGALGELEPPP